MRLGVGGAVRGAWRHARANQNGKEGGTKMGKYHDKMTLKQIFADPELKAVILECAPGVEKNPMLGMVMGRTLEQIAANLPNPALVEPLQKAITILKTQHS
jgi:hypothetical protein